MTIKHDGGPSVKGVTRSLRLGAEVRVTTLERTMVDLLDRPELGGNWEEIWRSLEAVEVFDLDQIVHYALLLGNATTAAKVGFFLEQHQAELMVGQAVLEALRALRPQQPHYLIRGQRHGGRWVKGWNLMVPDEILLRAWSEVQ